MQEQFRRSGKRVGPLRAPPACCGYYFPPSRVGLTTYRLVCYSRPRGQLYLGKSIEQGHRNMERQVFRFLPAVLTLIMTAILVSPVGAVDKPLFVSVPVLGVVSQNGKLVGATNFVAIQINRQTQGLGPQVQFNEGSRSLGHFKGGALGQDWKEAAEKAVFAASHEVGEDPRTLLVTIKNVSDAYLTDGPSASAPMAVAMIAAFRGAPILPGVTLTGGTDAEGHILTVGGIPEKIRAAAASGFSTVLIPYGQMRTREWDLRPLAESLHLTLIEVRTLREAYEKMTGLEF